MMGAINYCVGAVDHICMHGKNIFSLNLMKRVNHCVVTSVAWVNIFNE